ncbi:TrkA C-terminal domain-containing protein [Neobacillus kokaensis]|uniref:Potassium transporter TrkA n=1 Tax=Neobacillus kokaensis TaxID=2759023 RepID=A0ABQ3N1H5_9BACI|nr:TrkA C-terminal domain-containing protein [Neobacillus kokaensis]GHH98783.1 potassium transporter TrkA [Neobacillus kokaensis]
MILFLFIYFVIIFAVIEIFVILFRLTGLKRDVSRFQVISMMTATGFTTGESELILGHPIRRKLATFLILFGVFSLAVIISSISQFLSRGLGFREILLGAAVVMLIWGVLRIGRVQRMLAAFFNRKITQQVELADLPIREVFLKNKHDALVNLHIFQDSALAGQTLNQAVSDHDGLELVVLFIKRGNVIFRKNIYDTRLQEGDRILVYGLEDVIMKVFGDDIAVMEKRLKNLDISEEEVL